MADILKHRQFSDALTSYDLMKSAAIVLMIVDHLGAYFFPENEWLRALGRLCVPIWFFLIGYAQSRRIPADWMIGALILIAATWYIEGRFFQLNILVTMIAARLTLDFFAPLFLKNLSLFAAGSVLCAILAFYTAGYTDYGSLAIPLVMMGLAARAGQLTLAHVVVIYLVFLVTQYFMFGFAGGPLWLFMAGLPLPLYACWRFQPETMPQIFEIVKVPIQFMGRRTLEIYVSHMVLFQLFSSQIFS